MTGIYLTESQIKKILDAAKKQKSVTIKLSKDNLVGSHKLPLTESQINRIDKARNASIGLNLKLSYAQIKKIISEIQKSGGVIPLLSLVPIIASALGGAGALAGGVASAVSAANSAKASVKAQTELERHNREVEKELKGGNGLVSEKIGKHLKPILEKLGLGVEAYNRIVNGGCVKCGRGLFLKPYGSGLFIGPEN